MVARLVSAEGLIEGRAASARGRRILLAPTSSINSRVSSRTWTREELSSSWSCVTRALVFINSIYFKSRYFSSVILAN
jgi:hypothetical protein